MKQTPLRKMSAKKLKALQATGKRVPRSTLRIRIDPLDALFSTYIRLRADGICERCGQSIPIGRLQCCHYHGRANQQTRFDEDNVCACCFGCHQYFHSHPLEFTEWLRRRLGDTNFDLLTARTNLNHFKIDREAIRLYLQSKIDELQDIEHGF